MAQLGRNVLTTYVARFSNILGLFLLFPLVASAVDQEEYGVYLLATALATMFSLDLGMAGSTTRYVAAARAQKDQILERQVISTSYVFFLLMGFVGVLAVLTTFAVSWSSLDIPDDLVLTALSCAGLSAAQVFLGTALTPHRLFLAGVGRLDLSNWFQILQIALRLVGTVAVLSFHANVAFIALVDVFSVVSVGIATWFTRRRLYRDVNSTLRDASLSQFKNMFALTRDMLVLSVASVVILQSGSVIVGVVLGSVSIAVFAAAQRVYQVARELTNSLTAALLPAATQNHIEERFDKNSELYLIGTRYSNALLLLILPPAIALMPDLINAWLGPSYTAAAAPATVLVASMLINNQHLVAIPVLAGKGNLRSYSALHLVWAATAVTLGIPLTVHWGVIGTAIAIVLPIIVLESFYIRTILRSIGVGASSFIRSSILGPFLPGVFLLPALLLVRLIPDLSLSAIFLVFSGWAVLYASLFLRFFMPPDHRRAFLSRLRKR